MELLTERLRIREIELEDLDAVNAYASDPEVVRYLPFGPNTVDETKEFIRRAIAQRQAKPRYAYEMVLTLRNDGRLIGGVGLRGRDPQGDQGQTSVPDRWPDWGWPAWYATRQGDIGYILTRDLWGQGYVTEAGKAMLAFGSTS